MYQENVVLCGASAYEQKYYFNKDFDSLPDHVKKELQIMCVLFTEEIGGIFTLEFDDHGNLQFKTEATEADGFYDDIGGALKIKKLRVEKEELLESLESCVDKLINRENSSSSDVTFEFTKRVIVERIE